MCVNSRCSLWTGSCINQPHNSELQMGLCIHINSDGDDAMCFPWILRHGFGPSTRIRMVALCSSGTKSATQLYRDITLTQRTGSHANRVMHQTTPLHNAAFKTRAQCRTRVHMRAHACQMDRHTRPTLLWSIALLMLARGSCSQHRVPET